MLIGVLVLSAFYQSEWGGELSRFNTMATALAGGFLVLNLRCEERLLVLFAIPLAFLAISVFGNISGLPGGGYRIAGATAIGYMLLTLKPVPLDLAVFRRLLFMYLIVSLVLSFYLSLDRNSFSLLSTATGNAGFNDNPNSAALFLIGNIMLALVSVRGWARWALATLFSLLLLTTGSRAGVLCGAITLAGYALFSGVHPSRSVLRARIISTAGVVAALGVTALLAQQYFFEAVDFLALRFEAGSTRVEEWATAWEAISTLRTFTIGEGPSALWLRLSHSAHNSYLEAIGNSGIFFLITTLVAVAGWAGHMLRRGHTDVMWILPAVLTYGMFENILFNGINTVWLITIVLGIALKGGLVLASPPRPLGAGASFRAVQSRGHTPVRAAASAVATEETMPARRLISRTAPLREAHPRNR